MISIDKEYFSEYVINKSRFLSYSYPVFDEDKCKEILDSLKSKYNDATHVCYAYIINDDNVLLYKSSDDGEPSQTAGAPILNVIKRNNLTNVLCAVVRYFGGIKLGAGGLVRAYSNSAVEVVNKSTIVTLVDAYKGKFTFPYDKINFIDKFFETNNIEIVNKEYDLEVGYTVITYNKEDVSNIMNKISYLNVKYSDLGMIQTRKK